MESKTLNWCELEKKCDRCMHVIYKMIKLHGFPKGHYRRFGRAKWRMWTEQEIDEWLSKNNFPERRGRSGWRRNVS